MIKYRAKIFSVILGMFITSMFSFSQNILRAENNRTVYTIQVSSHQQQDLPEAIEIARRLQKKNFSDVRVELIGQFYTVRVGTYQSENETRTVFQEIRKEFPDSFVRTGYYIVERIVYPEKNTQPILDEKNDTAILPASSEKQTTAPAIVASVSEVKTSVTIENKENPAVEKNTQPVAEAKNDTMSSTLATEKQTSSSSVPVTTQPSEVQANTPVEKKEKPVETDSILVASGNQNTSEASEVKKGESMPENTSSEEKKNRLEVRFSYDYLAPNKDYGSWNQLAVVYSRQEKGFTYLITGEGFWRQEGSGGLIGFGLYKDWKHTMYTYTSISAGSGVDYLPVIRLDHSFDFKLGKKRNIIMPFGITYVRSPSDHEDYVLSTGVIVYLSKSVWEYKISWNYNQPGSVSSFSNLISVSWGKEGVQWWHFTCSYGQEAYLADYLLIPEQVRHDALTLELGLRKWLKKNSGIIVNIGYFNLQGSYEKYGLSTGFFTAF